MVAAYVALEVYYISVSLRRGMCPLIDKEKLFL